MSAFCVLFFCFRFVSLCHVQYYSLPTPHTHRVVSCRAMSRIECTVSLLTQTQMNWGRRYHGAHAVFILRQAMNAYALITHRHRSPRLTPGPPASRWFFLGVGSTSRGGSELAFYYFDASAATLACYSKTITVSGHFEVAWLVCLGSVTYNERDIRTILQ